MQRDPVDLAVDVAVIGAGPAGLAAAATAAEQGLSVVLLDEQAHPGGQIYRDVARAGADRLQVLGHDYAAGRALVDRFTRSTARHVGGAAVWNVTRDRVIHYLKDGRSQSMTARQVILCTGAMERPFPIPGWTLPGVMTAGAAQILLKSAGVGHRAGRAGGLRTVAVPAGMAVLACRCANRRHRRHHAARRLPAGPAPHRRRVGGLARREERPGPDPALPQSRYSLLRSATDLAVEGDARAKALAFVLGPSRTASRPTRAAAPGRGAEQPDHGVLRRPTVGTTSSCAGRRRPMPGAASRWTAFSPPVTGGASPEAPRRPCRQLAGLAALQDAGRVSELERDRQAEPLRRGASSPAAHPAFSRPLYRPAPASRAGRRCDRRRCEEISAASCAGWFARPHGTEPDQSLHALRHGPLPGPPLRPHGHQGHRA